MPVAARQRVDVEQVDLLEVVGEVRALRHVVGLEVVRALVEDDRAAQAGGLRVVGHEARHVREGQAVHLEHAVVVARFDAGLRELGLGLEGELQLDLELGALVGCAGQEQAVHVVDEHMLLAAVAVDVCLNGTKRQNAIRNSASQCSGNGTAGGRMRDDGGGALSAGVCVER